MNIDRITIRRLKSYGSYDNVAVELSCPVAPDEAWCEKLAELDDMVSLKIAQLVERDSERDRTYHATQTVSDLEHRAEDLRNRLDGMRNWMHENDQFIRVYESMTGKNVDIPF